MTAKKTSLQKFNGKLFGFFETGTEGVHWALQIADQPGYEGLVILKAGDHLKIYSDDGELVFEGQIQPNTIIGSSSRPNSTVSQPKALGRWIHWTQEGFEPDEWAMFFIDGNYLGIIERVINLQVE